MQITLKSPADLKPGDTLLREGCAGVLLAVTIVGIEPLASGRLDVLLEGDWRILLYSDQRVVVVE